MWGLTSRHYVIPSNLARNWKSEEEAEKLAQYCRDRTGYYIEVGEVKVTIGYEMDMRACVDRPWRNEKRLLLTL